MQNGYDLSYIEEQIKYWELQRTQYMESIRKNEVLENTQALLSEIHNVTIENSIRKRLYPNTSTIPIVENYYASSSKFLIIERAFLHSEHGYLSLVICRCSRDVELINSKLTMTDLKKASWEKYVNERLREDNRFYGLMKAIIEVLSGDNKYHGCIPFQKPCQFNAQRVANRRGYGNEYCGDMLMHAGTNYGDTTTFAIIGIIIE